jgi:hypothetical protein
VIDELSGHCGLPSSEISGISADVAAPAAKGKPSIFIQSDVEWLNFGTVCCGFCRSCGARLAMKAPTLIS